MTDPSPTNGHPLHALADKAGGPVTYTTPSADPQTTTLGRAVLTPEAARSAGIPHDHPGVLIVDPAATTPPATTEEIR